MQSSALRFSNVSRSQQQTRLQITCAVLLVLVLHRQHSKQPKDEACPAGLDQRFNDQITSDEVCRLPVGRGRDWFGLAKKRPGKHIQNERHHDERR